MAKQRKIWVDYSKSLLIFLMVICHAGLGSAPHVLIYSFHMPAFFIISGYLYSPHIWHQTVKSFVIPIIFFSICNIVLYLYLFETWENISLSYFYNKYIIRLWEFGSKDSFSSFPGIWFVEVLLLCRLLCGDIVGKIYSNKTYFILFVLLLVLFILTNNFVDEYISNVWIIRILPCLPFFIIGYLLKNSFLLLQYRLSNKIFYGVCVVGTLFLVFLNSYDSNVDIYFYQFGNSLFLFMLNAVSMSILLFVTLSYINKANNIVELLSKGTFVILGVHISLINIQDELLLYLGVPKNFITIFLESVIVMLISYFIILLISKKCPILMGKINKKTI